MAGAAAAQGGKVRTYYIAADEVEWNYVPGGINGMMGKPVDFVGYFQGADGKIFTKPESTTYLKCLYREYTDGTFKTLKPRPPRWRHLGMLGPVIRAEVGDTIRVVYRNNCSFPNSIHPHGVFYTRDNEGAPYWDGHMVVHPGDSVPPGGTYTYVWEVPARAGPGPNDPNSIVWPYMSHTNPDRDDNAGLVGAIIITARGQSQPNGMPKGVDREFVTWFAQIHEEESWYAEHNLPTLATDHAVPFPMAPNSASATYPYFVTFSINGYSYSSNPLEDWTMRKGEHVRWYIIAGLNDFDFHNPHWHGNTVMVSGKRTDVTFVGDMQSVVADMVPDDVGVWMFHCHIEFHNAMGMNVRYVVKP